MSDSPVGPDDIRAAAEVYHELAPEYRSAVLASFLAKVDREVDVRVAARLAERRGRLRRRLGALASRRRLRDVAAAGLGAAAVLTAVSVIPHAPSDQWTLTSVPAVSVHRIQGEAVPGWKVAWPFEPSGIIRPAK